MQATIIWKPGHTNVCILSDRSIIWKPGNTKVCIPKYLIIEHCFQCSLDRWRSYERGMKTSLKDLKKSSLFSARAGVLCSRGIHDRTKPNKVSVEHNRIVRLNSIVFGNRTKSNAEVFMSLIMFDFVRKPNKHLRLDYVSRKTDTMIRVMNTKPSISRGLLTEREIIPFFICFGNN